MSTTLVDSEFRARLTQVLERFGSVVALANAVGVSDNAIYKWLAGRGQPSMANLVAVDKVVQQLAIFNQVRLGYVEGLGAGGLAFNSCRGKDKSSKKIATVHRV